MTTIIRKGFIVPPQAFDRDARQPGLRSPATPEAAGDPGPTPTAAGRRRLYLLSLLLAACAADDGGEPIVEAADCIFGGDAQPAPLDLDGRQVQAIAAVSVWRHAESSPFGLCTGTLLDPRWLLTARHCAPYDDVELRVLVGAAGVPTCGPGAVPLERRGATRLFPHPTLDLLLAELDAPVDIDFEPLTLETGDALRVGAAVELAGFGETEDGSVGRLLFAASSVAALDATHVEVDGQGLTGACTGDSGGPLLLHTASGTAVAGVLSEGDASCLGHDRYLRTSAAADWVSETRSR